MKTQRAGRLVGGGWLPLSSLMELRTEVWNQRMSSAQPVDIYQWPSELAAHCGQISSGAVLIERNWRSWGRLADGRGWIRIDEMEMESSSEKGECVVCMEHDADT